MSLLTNPWLNIGMGLLANSGPSLTPINPWRGIGQGLMAANEAKAMEQQAAYEQSRMAMEQQKYEAEQQRQAQMQSIIQSLPSDQQQLAMADPQGFFDARIKQQFAAPPAPKLPDGWMIGPDGKAMMIPGYQAEQKPQTSGIELQGPNGEPIIAESVQKAQEIIANNPGVKFYQPPPSVQVTNNMDKGVSVADAANLRYPDGSRVIAGTPMSVIYERGAVSVTQADNTDAVTKVNIKGYDESLKKAAVSLKNANRAYHDDPSAANYQKLKAARSSAATALAQRRNTKGEPSGEIVQGAEADFPLPFSAGGAMGAAMGADPIEASLRQVDELYGLGIYDEEKPKSKAATKDGASIFDMYPGLRK